MLTNVDFVGILVNVVEAIDSISEKIKTKDVDRQRCT